MTENSLALARREANCIDCDLQDAARAKGSERISDLRNAEQRIQMLAYHIGKALDFERVAAFEASGWKAFREAALSIHPDAKSAPVVGEGEEHDGL